MRCLWKGFYCRYIQGRAHHRDTEREFREAAAEAFRLPAALPCHGGSADSAFQMADLDERGERGTF